MDILIGSHSSLSLSTNHKLREPSAVTMNFKTKRSKPPYPGLKDARAARRAPRQPEIGGRRWISIQLCCTLLRVSVFMKAGADLRLGERDPTQAQSRE